MVRIFLSTCISSLQLGNKLLDKTSGNMKPGKETWWRNEDVQVNIKTEKLAKRTLDKDDNEESNAAYKTAKKEAKKNVAIAMHGYHQRTEDSFEDVERKGK